MICDHPESVRIYESRSQPAEGGGRSVTRVVRCQRCGAVLYPATTPTTEPEDTPV